MNGLVDALDLIKPMVRGEFLVMATCGYSSYVGGPCGSSNQNHKNVQCVPLSDCQWDVSLHLKALNVWDSSLKTEAQLLLEIYDLGSMPFRITSYHLRLRFTTPSHTKTLKIVAFAE